VVHEDLHEKVITFPSGWHFDVMEEYNLIVAQEFPVLFHQAECG
jgi:hypothetical protein